jgi:agmatine deiminase
MRFCFIFLLFCSACRFNPPATAPLLHRPAEFEPTQAVWLLWSNYDHKKGYHNEEATRDIITALLPFVQVKLVVPNDSVMQRARTLFPAGALESGQLQLLKMPYREFWTRDMGPSFVIDPQGNLQVTDFNFNDWGYAAPGDSLAALDEKLDERIAALMHVPVQSSDIITEGGDHEVNGKGTVLLTESVELTRNPALSKTTLESEFRRMLGVRNIIWLKRGLREDDYTFSAPMYDEQGHSIYTVLTTNGHVDEYARFASPTTILLAQADSNAASPIERENARRLEVNYQILQQARDQDGRPFQIIRMPLPVQMIDTMRPGDGVYDIIADFTYQDGSKFPKGSPVLVMPAASYLNFLIANGCVLIPRYWKPGMDDRIRERDSSVMQTFQSVFPDKKIIQLNALAVNLGGGGIHCITMNEPVHK